MSSQYRLGHEKGQRNNKGAARVPFKAILCAPVGKSPSTDVLISKAGMPKA